MIVGVGVGVGVGTGVPAPGCSVHPAKRRNITRNDSTMMHFDPETGVMEG
jgi:hypothetical protein